MEDFEKLGEFYLGRETAGDKNLLLYNSKHLTTHGIIVGMTGSGKTGLALAMMEEAAIDGVPAILIDPKGDLANILLQFPDLQPADFRPWIDAGEAARAGISPDELAAKTARQWRDGLAKWGQDGDRIRMLSRSADFAVYTPGDTTGRPLQILSSFAAPEGADELTLRDSILNSVSSLLGLVGITADPVQSREHILLSAIFYKAWKEGRDLSLEQVISEVATPPFAKIGVFDLESFFASKDRMKLALSLNSLLASPSFAAWREGEPLDIGRLLHAANGRPRISVLSIAHLSDAERMFFVTSLLNATIAWMRRQTGTGSLRALLYMDEIFGYFPPNSNPPSKSPMLTLLKQARAFGLGILLSTQNPVDLDYKGLSNCGTWFIGRLQTDRDKQRVLDGLEGVAAEGGKGFDRAGIDKLLSGLGKRVFLMRDANDDQPKIFETRWVMSYMCGPMSVAQIKSLMKAPSTAPAMPSPFPPLDGADSPAFSSPAFASPAFPPMGANDVPASVSSPVPAQPQPAAPEKAQSVAATVRLHFVNAKTNTDLWQTRNLLAPLSPDGWPRWEAAEELDSPAAKATLGSVISDKQVQAWGKALASHIYQDCTLEMWRDPVAKICSAPGESEGDFRVRAAQFHRERRDAEIEKLTAAYKVKLDRAADAKRQADDKVDREKAQKREKQLSTGFSLGATILGALLGRGKGMIGTVSRASTTARRASTISKESQDVAAAEEAARIKTERYEALQTEFRQALDDLKSPTAPQDIRLEEIVARPRKTDILVERIYLA